MSRSDKELAYLYDLHIMPIWRDCFDRLFNEKCGLPNTGDVLDINCGTGGHAIEMAKMLAGKGKVVAVDESLEAIKLANAKSSIAKLDNINFSVASTSHLVFPDNTFDMVISDVSLLAADKLAKQLDEVVRVAKPKAKIIFYLTSKGSFDEFFSVFWEALFYCGLSEKLQVPIETFINECPAPTDSEKLLKDAGLKNVTSYLKKEVFCYKGAEEFFASPLMEEYFFNKWFGIIPNSQIKPVRKSLEEIIERDRNGYDFDVSIKATLIVGEKK